MFSITLSKKDIDEFGARFAKQKKARIHQALALVRLEWQKEFRRQDASMQKQWTPLKTWTDSRSRRSASGTGPDPKSYAERKKAAYYSGKSRGGDVRYLRILKRTGVMLERYISGISVNNNSMTVSIPFPKDEVGIRAKVHQGYDENDNPTQLPEGVLSTRPYNLERFEFVANRVLRRELYKD